MEARNVKSAKFENTQLEYIEFIVETFELFPFCSVFMSLTVRFLNDAFDSKTVASISRHRFLPSSVSEHAFSFSKVLSYLYRVNPIKVTRLE